MGYFQIQTGFQEKFGVTIGCNPNGLFCNLLNPNENQSEVDKTGNKG